MTQASGLEASRDDRKRAVWRKAQAARRARLLEGGTVLLRLLCSKEEAQWITQELLKRRREARMALRKRRLAADDASSIPARKAHSEERTCTGTHADEAAALKDRRRKLRAMLAAHRSRSG